MKEETEAVGRPTKYKEEFNEQAYSLALLGLTDKQIAKFFKIDETTFYKWKKKYEQFGKSLEEGKDVADIKVTKSLFKRATGCVANEEKQERDESGNIIKTITVTKEVLPDVAAITMWLKNRRPDQWRERQEVTSTNVNVTIDTDDPQEASRKYQELMGN